MGRSLYSMEKMKSFLFAVVVLFVALVAINQVTALPHLRNVRRVDCSNLCPVMRCNPICCYDGCNSFCANVCPSTRESQEVWIWRSFLLDVVSRQLQLKNTKMKWTWPMAILNINES